jgi:non-homologous end joining protein Ku
MPPPRPYWKGYLKLSLVSCPIALYTATSAAERAAAPITSAASSPATATTSG